MASEDYLCQHSSCRAWCELTGLARHERVDCFGGRESVFVPHMKGLCVLCTQPPRSLRPQWHHHLAYTARREGDRSQDCGARERRWLGDGDAPGVLRGVNLHAQRDPLAVAARSEVYRRMEHARHEGVQDPAVAAARLDCRRPG